MGLKWRELWALFSHRFLISSFFPLDFHALFAERHFKKLMMYEYARMMCTECSLECGKLEHQTEETKRKKDTQKRKKSGMKRSCFLFQMARKEFICSTTCYLNDKWISTLSFTSDGKRKRPPHYHHITILKPKHTLICFSKQIFMVEIVDCSLYRVACPFRMTFVWRTSFIIIPRWNNNIFQLQPL